jgi:hypothetical protein
VDPGIGVEAVFPVVIDFAQERGTLRIALGHEERLETVADAGPVRRPSEDALVANAPAFRECKLAEKEKSLASLRGDPVGIARPALSIIAVLCCSLDFASLIR